MATQGSAMESVETYDLVKRSLRTASKRRGLTSPYKSFPEIVFRLDRKFDGYSYLLAYDFIIEFFHLSGAKILEVGVEDGCVKVNLRLFDHLSETGADLRQSIFKDNKYHVFLTRYDVSQIYFHCFPNSSNFDHVFQIGTSGIPFG
jgi:hypothetical protein